MKRFPDMAKEKFCMLSILVLLIAVAQSSTISRPSKEDSSGIEEEDKGYGLDSKWERPFLGDPDFWIDSFRDPSLPEHDINENEIDDSISGGDPDRFIPDLYPDEDYEEDVKEVDGNVDDDYETDETDEGGIDKPFSGEDDLDESLGGKDDPEEPVVEVEEEVVDEDQIDEEDDKTSEGVDDALENKPGFGGEEKGPGFLGGDSIFDTPLFSLEQVRKYFHQMEKALEHAFKETVDEALLLNGTFANTTEEEVDINGKKYTVLKSILKGRDNNTSLYVETLSSKPKEEGGKEAISKKV